MENIANQHFEGNKSIVALMIESHLNWVNQKISDNMGYGVSLTDACIDWATTENSIKEMAAKLREVLPKRNA